MARDFPGTANNHLYMPFASVPAAPAEVTISAWFRVDDSGGYRRIASRDNQATGKRNYQLMWMTGTTNLRWGWFNSGGIKTATATGLTVGNVYHVACAAKNGTAGEIWINGSSADTGPTVGVDQDDCGIAIGGLVYNDSTPTLSSQSMDGMVCEVAEWGVRLSDAEIVALSRGVSPALINPGDLNWYFPMVGGAGDEQGFGGVLTEYGTVADTDHVPIIRPTGPVSLGIEAGAAPSSTIPPLAYYYRRRRA